MHVYQPVNCLVRSIELGIAVRQVFVFPFRPFLFFQIRLLSNICSLHLHSFNQERPQEKGPSTWLVNGHGLLLMASRTDIRMVKQRGRAMRVPGRNLP